MASVIQAGTASNTALTLSSDTSGELQLKTNSGSTTAMTLTTAGNVGIGTTSPTYTLEVATGTSGQQSLANFRTANSTAANNAGLQIFATPSATAGSRNVLVSWDADGADTSGGDYFYIQKLGNSGNVELAQYSNAAMIFSTNVGTERMRITSGGNVGIGTNNPSATLQVVGNIISGNANGSGAIQVGSNSASQYQYINIGGNANGDNGWQVGKADTGGSIAPSLGFYIYDLKNATSRMVIDTSGNVGIGTSSPSAKLHVSGGQIIVNTTDNTSNIYLQNSGTTYFQIRGNTTSALLNNPSAGPMVFGTSDTERMRINSNGTVSIGNTSNVYTLDVTGSIRATTYLYASGGAAGHGLYLADGSSNGLISQMSNGSASTVTYIGNQTITTSSDIRIKNNVRPTERNALELLSQWEIVDHNWNDPSDQCENNKNSRGVWTGVIAQQIQPITPWLVNKPLEDENKDGSKNLWLVDFAYSVPLLVKAIQEQQAQIEELKQEVAKLKGV